MPTVSLIDIPRPLRKGLTRRLPRGGKFKDLTGAKYGRCMVLGFAGYKGAFAAWLCRCRCGNLFVREGAYMVRRESSGCGCSRTHKSPIPKYIRVVWFSMKARCYNPRHRDYHLYGKRGIKICKRWLTSMEKFAEDMGPRPSPRHIFCRRDAAGDFTRANCFWGTSRDRPSKRIRHITHDGRTQSIAAWAEELGISRQAMHYRVNECLRRGIDVTLALTAPARRGTPMFSSRRSAKNPVAQWRRADQPAGKRASPKGVPVTR